MTTTADKIKDIQLELKRTENGLQQSIAVINALQKELVDVKQSTKPADPEPLECRVNVYEGERLPACVHMDEQRARILRLFRKVTCLLDSQPR